MAISSINHKSIGKKTHPPRTASAHLRYILRASACNEVLAANLPVPEIGTRGGKTKAWLEEREDKSRKNARILDKLMIALPVELTQKQRVEMLKDYVHEITGGEDIPWLAAMHDQESHNPHVHMIFFDRGLQTGKRVVEFSEGGSTFRLRESWEKICNEHLEKAGSDARIDVRSLKVQRKELLEKAAEETDPEKRQELLDRAEKLNRRPAGHEGPEAQGIEKKGEVSEKLARLRESRAKVNNEEISWERYHPEGDFLRYPNPDTVKNLIAKVSKRTKPSQPIAETDQAASAWWDLTFETEEFYCGYVTLLADSLKSVDLESLLKETDKLFDDLNLHPDHPILDDFKKLSQLGQKMLRGGWRAFPKLAQALRDYAAQNPNTMAAAIPADADKDEQSQGQTSPETEALKDTTTVDTQQATQKQHAEPESENTDADNTAETIPEAPEETASPSQSAAEARRARQEARAEEKVLKAREKAAQRANEKIERKIKASRNRVLRGRRTINTFKGFVGNVSAGSDALAPYPQSQMRSATDTFLSAARALMTLWDNLREHNEASDDFKNEEKAYIDASAELEEMHLVVPKPSQMSGNDLLDERARLEEIRDFPDQGLINPFIRFVKNRLEKIIAYLTGNPDGKAKVAEVAETKRREEAEKQQQAELEQQRIEQRNRESQERNRKSTARKVMNVLERGKDDPEILAMVTDYGFDMDRSFETIAADPFWLGFAPGTQRLAWYDLKLRIEELEQTRKQKQEANELKRLSPTIEQIIDRANQSADPNLHDLLEDVLGHRFTSRQTILENPQWLQPVRKDPDKTALWEAALRRIEELDRIEQRLKKQREEQDTAKPNPPKRNNGFTP